MGECLYRYVPTGTYNARIKRSGKEVRRSLETTDRVTAKRRLADLHKDIGRVVTGSSRVTLADLCDRYLATVQNQWPKTLAAKNRAVARIKADFPGGSDVSAGKVVASQVSAWLASYPSGAATYNSYLEFIRAAFALAVRDKLVADSPATGIKTKKRFKPIRRTPSFEDFKAIVADIRAQTYNADARESTDFVEFLGMAGLGQAEASALCWGDLNFSTDQAAALRIKTGLGFALPTYPQLRPLLERLREQRGGSPHPDERVFVQKEAKKAIANACKRLGLPAYSHRAFRRMFITRAIERGVDVKAIAEWQGHRDGGKLILDTYSHVAPKHSARMAKLMSEETNP